MTLIIDDPLGFFHTLEECKESIIDRLYIFFLGFLPWRFPTAMFLEDASFLTRINSTLHTIEDHSSLPVCDFDIDDRMRIVTTEYEVILYRLHLGYLPRLCLEMLRKLRKLWKIYIHESSITILIVELLRRVIYSDRIDPHSSRLHLELHIVDPWLIISKQSSEPVSKSPLPWLHTRTTDK